MINCERKLGEDAGHLAKEREERRTKQRREFAERNQKAEEEEPVNDDQDIDLDVEGRAHFRRA